MHELSSPCERRENKLHVLWLLFSASSIWSSARGLFSFTQDSREKVEQNHTKFQMSWWLLWLFDSCIFCGCILVLVGNWGYIIEESDSLRHHGLYSPSQNTGVGNLSLPRGLANPGIESRSPALMLKLKLQYFATWCEELTHLKRPWCWERLKAGGEGDESLFCHPWKHSPSFAMSSRFHTRFIVLIKQKGKRRSDKNRSSEIEFCKKLAFKCFYRLLWKCLPV